MSSITTRYQNNARDGGFMMMASGIAAVFLFVVATAVVGFDTASKDQRFAAAGATATQTHAQGVPATAAR